MPTLTISGCWRAWAPSEPAICKPSASAWSTQAWLGARAIQWVAAGQAKTSRAEPATAAAATRAALFRNADTIADSVRCREGEPVRAAGSRGCLRCRASVLDTIEPSVGRAGRAQLPPGCWPGTSHRQWRADDARVPGDGIAGDATRWVLLMHQAAPHAGLAGPELRNRQL